MADTPLTVQEVYQQHKQRVAKQREAEKNSAHAFMVQHKWEVIVTKKLGPLDTADDSDQVKLYKNWTRAVKRITSTLKIPYVLDRELPKELREAQAKTAKKSSAKADDKRASNEKRAADNEKAIFGAPGYQLEKVFQVWMVDTTQPLVLPPPVSYYNGWPKKPYSFNHLQAVQELNFPWHEFLYAWVPSGGHRPFTFAKKCAALGAFGLIVEYNNSDSQLFRIRFRGIEHFYRSLVAYTEFAKNEDGSYVYVETETSEGTKRIRKIDACYGIPLVYHPQMSIQYDTTSSTEYFDYTISAFFQIAINISMQRVALIEDALPLAEKPRWWKHPDARFTCDELMYWIKSEENRQMNEAGWKQFNAQSTYIKNGKQVSIVNVTPSAGYVNKMTANGIRVLFEPNGLRPLLTDVAYEIDLAPPTSFIQSAQDVVNADYAAKQVGEKTYALRYIAEQYKDKSKKENCYNIQGSCTATKISMQQQDDWSRVVMNTYARSTPGFAVPINQLSADLQSIINKGTYNRTLYKKVNTSPTSESSSASASQKTTHQADIASSSNTPQPASSSLKRDSHVSKLQPPVAPSPKRVRTDESNIALRPSTSETSLLPDNMYANIKNIAILLRARHSEMYCKEVGQLGEEMINQYEHFRGRADMKIQQIKGKDISPSRPAQLIKKFREIAAHCELMKDVVRTAIGRSREHVEPTGKQTRTRLPKTIANLMREQKEQREQALQETDTRITDCPKSDKDRLKLLNVEKLIHQAYVESIVEVLAKYNDDRTPITATKASEPKLTTASNLSEKIDDTSTTSRRSRKTKTPKKLKRVTRDSSSELSMLTSLAESSSPLKTEIPQKRTQKDKATTNKPLEPPSSTPKLIRSSSTTSSRSPKTQPTPK